MRLVCGDAIEEMRKMPAASVDLIVTDPPYGHNNNNGDLISRREQALGLQKHEGERRPIANDGNEANDLFAAMLPEANRLLRTGGCCCCCCGGGGPDPMFARWSMLMDGIFDFKQMVVWDKGPMGMGWHYRRSYETVLVASKRGGKVKWYDTSHKVENIIRPGVLGIRKILPSAEQHPTEKPWQLAAFFILLHSLPGESVLDPFMGSGAFGEAALRLGRSYVGIECDALHFVKAKRRLDAIEGAPTLALA